jgi:hypothetical protein
VRDIVFELQWVIDKQDVLLDHGIDDENIMDCLDEVMGENNYIDKKLLKYIS